MSARISFVFVSLLAACGGDDGGNNNMQMDAPPVASVALVDPCPATADATIMTLATRFEPMATTINQGQVVKFESTSTHPVRAQTGTDPALMIPEGATRCFRFTMPGTYKFQCSVHGYAGTITVN